MKSFFSSRFNNQEGVTLIMVIMVMVVLSVLGLGILGMAVNNTYLTGTERDYQSAYYIAEAGVAKEFSQIEASVTEFYESRPALVFFGQLEADILGASETYNDFKPSFGESPSAVVTVTKGEKLSETSQEYTISSLGIIGERKRTVERKITVNWQDSRNLKLPEDMAVYTNKEIKLSGGASINGNAGTNLEAAGSISLDGGASITNGKLYVPAGWEDKAINASDDVKNKLPRPIAHERIEMKLPEFPEFPSYSFLPNEMYRKGNNEPYEVIQNGNLRINTNATNGYTLRLKENVDFKEILITSGNTLNIDTGNSDKEITVDHLNIQNGFINITGSGSLTFYIRDKTTLGSGSTINNGGSVGKLTIYLKGSGSATSPKTVTLAGNQKIFGSLYAEDARIHLTGGGGYQGHILTGGDLVTIEGGTRNNTLILAPNAQVNLTGGGIVEGAIYSDYLTGEGGSAAIHKEMDFSSIPFGSSGDAEGPVDMIVTEPISEVNKQ